MIPRPFPVRSIERRRDEIRSALSFAALSLVCLAVFYFTGPIPPAPASILAIVRWLGLLFGLLFGWLFLQNLVRLAIATPVGAKRALALLALAAAAVGLWAWLG